MKNISLKYHSVGSHPVVQNSVTKTVPVADMFAERVKCPSTLLLYAGVI
jgi:hypothetical protein